MISPFRAVVWGLIPTLHFLIWLKIGRDAAPLNSCIKLGIISPFVHSDITAYDETSKLTACKIGLLSMVIPAVDDYEELRGDMTSKYCCCKHLSHYLSMIVSLSLTLSATQYAHFKLLFTSPIFCCHCMLWSVSVCRVHEIRLHNNRTEHSKA